MTVLCRNRNRRYFKRFALHTKNLAILRHIIAMLFCLVNENKAKCTYYNNEIAAVADIHTKAFFFTLCKRLLVSYRILFANIRKYQKILMLKWI